MRFVYKQISIMAIYHVDRIFSSFNNCPEIRLCILVSFFSLFPSDNLTDKRIQLRLLQIRITILLKIIIYASFESFFRNSRPLFSGKNGDRTILYLFLQSGDIINSILRTKIEIRYDNINVSGLYFVKTVFNIRYRKYIDFRAVF